LAWSSKTTFGQRPSIISTYHTWSNFLSCTILLSHSISLYVSNTFQPLSTYYRLD
jgi:hypothetical protein